MNKTETHTLRGKVGEALEFYMERKTERIWEAFAGDGSFWAERCGGSGTPAMEVLGRKPFSTAW